MTRDTPNAYSFEQARFAAIAKGWPALYVALCAVLAAVAFVHADLAPWWAWGIFPIFLVPKAVLWLAMWRGKRGAVPSTEECAHAVRILSVEVVFCVAAFVAWQVWLAQWGTPISLVFLSLCMGGEMVFILFGLLHLRMASVVAAITCAAGILMVAAGADGANGLGPHITGLVILMAGGLTGLAHIAYTTYSDFRSLVISRHTLASQNEQIRELGRETLRIANTDMLTEIGNRRSCFHELEAALETARRTGGRVSFGVIDLDGFKGVNDTNGHLVGDRLLTAMAERLKRNLAPHGEVFRLGGDEFAFIVLNEDEEDALLSIGNEIIASVRQPLHIGGLSLLLGCSVGFASFPRTARDAVELYDRADHVLYHAKRTGRARTVVFGEAHRRVVEASSAVEDALRGADLAEELFPAFRPVLDRLGGRTLLMEALPRWRSPVLGLVEPERFMTVAEQSGLVSTLTPIMLAKALDAVKDWPEEVGLSVNLSRFDLLPEKILRLVAILGLSGVSPGRVTFELPEAALAKDSDETADSLRRIRATGARLSLGRVGIGRFGLRQVQTLGLGGIKIDPSLARDLTEGGTNHAIVRSIAALCRELSIDCVADGVDTREQYEILQGTTVTSLQGDFLAKPMEAGEATRFLEFQHRRRAGTA